jgi:hypothetical protein
LQPAVLAGEPVDALFSMTIDFSLAADGRRSGGRGDRAC